MKSRSFLLLEFHLGLFILSMPPLFAKVIDIPADLLIWARSGLTAITLALFIALSGKKFRLKSVMDYKIFILLGVLFAIHWVAFFYAVQISTVAIGMISTLTYPVFTSIIEPLFFKEKFKILDLLSALTVLAGVAFIVPELSLDNNITLGASCGLIAAISMAFRNVISRKYVHGYPGSVMMFYQVLVAAIVIAPVLFIPREIVVSASDIAYILVLAVVITTLGHTFFIRGFRIMTTRTAGVLATLEILYSTLLAIMILDEIPRLRTIIGGLIIFAAVAFESMRLRQNDQELVSSID